MDNISTKTNSENKTQSSDLPTNNLRDPNIILPQSRRNTRLADISKPIDMQAKTSPVMLRSFNKDISEAMAKKKRSGSIKDIEIPKVPKTPKISQPPKAPEMKKTASEIKTKPIPSAPAPESFASKKEATQADKVTLPKLDNKDLKKGKDLSSKIFPQPPQTRERKFIKKDTLSQQKSDAADQKTQEKQKLRDDFDRMIHGEHINNDQDLSQAKKPSPIITNKTKTKTALSEAAINIHVSADELKKRKEEIFNIDTEEKELESKLQDITEREITLTKEENQEEAERNLAKGQLNDILQQEREVESMIHDIEKQEKEALGADERHNIETKRWAQEEKRVQFEKNKWDIGETYEKLTASLKEKRIKLEQVRSSKEDINKKIAVLLIKKKQKEVKVHLGEIERKKEEIENIQMALLGEKKGIDRSLALLKENKQKIIEERRFAEENEAKVEVMSEKRIFEEKRQNMEIRQRSIEQQRWEAEQKLEQIMKKIKNANEQYKVTASMEEEIRKKLQ